MIYRFLLLLTLIVFTTFSVNAQSNPCISQNAIRVVILGSSTAAGTGPSAPDSAWVNRYRNYLESINPNNEVINLAQGGYTTYRIMRTGYTPPPNRPVPDVNRNITEALLLDPDAIIVNMPSNDVSSGYSYQEQMDNLDSIVELSTNSSVPIWICTTQPKNFSNSVLRQLQSDLKDSILVRFAPRTIDFWTTIALPDNSIDPTYDSGDGTHLNDAGHAILANRVISVDIPLDLYVPTSTVDYALTDATPSGFVGCGDSSTLISLVVANLGIDETSASQVIVSGINLDSGTSFGDTLIQLGGIGSCSTDTLSFTANLYSEGNYSILIYTNNPNDTLNVNDSLLISLQSLGHPTLLGINDTLCEAGTAQLSVITEPQDTVFWYLNALDTVAFDFGTSILTSTISTTTTMFAEAVRGDLFYRDSLSTTLNSNVNWNGAMFDIVAQEDLIIDSFYAKINTLGTQEVRIYTKPSTHIGYETSAASWNLLGSTFVEVTSNQEYTSIPLGDFTMLSQDTLGVYVQMANSSSTLTYRSVSAPISRSTNELEIITGSGVSSNFSASYFPRDINGGVHYHFGSRPLGECSTGKIPVTVFVSETSFNLGNDTIIDIEDSITFYGPLGQSDYQWFDGSTLDSLQISANQLGNGIHYISLSVIDSLGCEKADSLILAIADLVGLTEQSNYFFFYPNPTTDMIYFAQPISGVRIINLLGEVVQSIQKPISELSLSEFPSGVYLLELKINGHLHLKRCIKQN